MGTALCQKPGGGGHDLGNAGLIVSTQQGGTVGGYQPLAHVGVQGGIIGTAQVDLLFGVDAQILTGIGQHLGLDVLAGGIGRGVHMGDQADGGQAGITGYGAGDVAVFVHLGILDAKLQHLSDQRLPQNQLAGGGGTGGSVFVGLGVIGNVG